MTEQNQNETPLSIEERLAACEAGVRTAVHYIQKMPAAIGAQLRDVHDNIMENAERAAAAARAEDEKRRAAEDARNQSRIACQQKQHAQMLAAGTVLNALVEDALRSGSHGLVADKDWQRKTATLAWDIADAFLAEREHRLWKP